MSDERTITIPTANGPLTLAVEQLMPERVSYIWDEYDRSFKLIIVWHDNGQPGHPQIERKGDELVITVRSEKEVEEDSVLSRANRLAAQLADAKNSFELAEID